MNEKTVLFVDDEDRILKTIERIVHRKPFKAIFAESGAAALKLLESQEVHVVVTDMRMPEMTGLQLLREVKDKYPHIVRVVLSGYTQITTLLTAINEGEIFRYVTKPWEKNEDLISVVMAALEHGEKAQAVQPVASGAPSGDATPPSGT
ncbi:MAG: response regulator [Planctomycetes bacterium]|nr:response regulator [Planctomycetota bacterium]